MMRRLMFLIMLVLLAGCAANISNSYENIPSTDEVLKYYDYFYNNGEFLGMFCGDEIISFAQGEQPEKERMWDFILLSLSESATYDVVTEEEYKCFVLKNAVDVALSKYFDINTDSALIYNDIYYDAERDAYEYYPIGMTEIYAAKLTDYSISDDLISAHFNIYDITKIELEDDNNIDCRSEVLKENSEFLKDPKKITLTFRELYDDEGNMYLQYISLTAM